MNYRQQFHNYTDCHAAAWWWSKHHPGHYYVSVVGSGCYEISPLSEDDGEPYWHNGVLVYPKENFPFKGCLK